MYYCLAEILRQLSTDYYLLIVEQTVLSNRDSGSAQSCVDEVKAVSL